MTNETTTAIENKKSIRKEHGDSSIQYKIAKAESKKLKQQA